MSSLPKNPSLERIKKEAKALLKSFKKGDSDSFETLRMNPAFSEMSDAELEDAKVTLQQAQHALARSYDFDNWADLVDEVRGEAKTKSADPSFKQLLEAVYDAVIVADLEGMITKHNEHAQRLFNYSAQELSGMNILDVVNGADEETLATIVKTLQTEKRIFIEGFCRRKDETTFPAEIAVSIIKTGGVESVLFFIRNISLRVQTEEKLKSAMKIIVKNPDLMKEMEEGEESE